MRSSPLGVPYTHNAPLTLPTLGDRPVQPTGVVNGVPKHTRTATPIFHEVPPQKKRTLNLLNPVNLLMRRRSGVPQNTQHDPSPSKKFTVPPMTLPEDYDPRIRGNVVHDFSAPRPRRTTSQDTKHEIPSTAPKVSNREQRNHGQSPSQKAPDDSSQAKRSSQHTPVFKEHLDDDIHGDTRSAGVNAESLANADFLKRVSQIHQDPVISSGPSFSPPAQGQDFQQFRKSIGDWQARVSYPSSISSKSESGSPPTDLKQAHQSPKTEQRTPELKTQATPPPNDTPKSTESSCICPQHPSPQPAQSSPDPDLNHDGFPRHFKSNASRFSFQLTGYDNIVEEKLLEERARRERAAADAKRDVIPDEDEDYFDEDAMYDADELEGLNHSSPEPNDAQTGEFTGLAPQQPIDSLVPTPDYDAMEEENVEHPNQNVKNYLEYQRLQARLVTEDGSYNSTGASATPRPSVADFSATSAVKEERPDSHQGYSQQSIPPQSKVGTEYGVSRASHDFDDDLYFNDGSFEEMHNYSDGEEIDEDELFGSDDDEHQVRKGRAFAATVTLPPQIPQLPPSMAHRLMDSASLRERVTHPAVQAPALSTGAIQLAAYHNALVEATHKAAADGKFSRSASSATFSSKYSQLSTVSRHSSKADRSDAPSPPLPSAELPSDHPARPGRESYSGFDFGFNRANTHSTTTPLSPAFPLDTGSEWLHIEEDYDDLDEDDAIISEANADALASDDEGFYGREFGFYAKARPGVNDEGFVNGGFFGTPGESTIERKHSVREPNLTPITERSEMSTRNSLIGGPFSPAVATPAFAAQLARLSPLALAHLQDDDMSLEQIARLRSLAFTGTDGTGRSGSVSSMSSAAGYAGGLPLSHRGSWTVAAGSQFPIKNASPIAMHNADSSRSSIRMSRSHSETLHDSTFAHSPVAESPLSLQNARLTAWHGRPMSDLDLTPRKPILEPDSPQAPTTVVKNTQRPVRGHHRTSSGGGDSVTYTKERDDDGRERWILERRRTSEAGLVELVGREVVEGGI